MKSSNIDLNALMLFYVAASEGSLARASAATGVPKATLSRKLRALEAQLELVLLKRGAQGITLTDAGESIMRHCEQINRQVEETRDIATEIMSEPSGVIRISMPQGFGGAIVSRVIARVARQYPRLRQEIHITNDPINLSDAPYDVAIYVGKIGNENLPSRVLAELERGFFASPEFCSGNGIPQSAEELVNFDRVLLATHLGKEIWPAGACNPDHPNVRGVVSDTSVLFQLAVQGMGIAVLPAVMCNGELQAGKLVRLLPQVQLPPALAYVSYPAHRYQSARLRVFLDVLREEFNTAAEFA